MNARRSPGVATGRMLRRMLIRATLVWLLPLLVLLSASRCGPDPAAREAEAVADRLEPTGEVLGPPPGERAGLGISPVGVVGDGEGWLVLWNDWGQLRGARLGADGTPVDPSPGLLLGPPLSPLDTGSVGIPATAALPATWALVGRGWMTLLHESGPPADPAALPETPFPVGAIAAGHGRFLVPAPDRWVAFSANGDPLWEVPGPGLVLPPPVPVATAGGFLVGWTEGGRSLVRPVSPDGELGETVTVAGGELLGLAAGDAGVLAWIGTDPPRLERLDGATGVPTGEATTAFGAGRSLLATQTGWLLEGGAQGWEIDPDLNVTPVSLPFEPGLFESALDGSGPLIQVIHRPDDPVRAGFVADGPEAYAVVSRGIESLRVRAVGAGPEGQLIVQEAFGYGFADHPVQAWRVGREGERTDETALDLGSLPILGAPGHIRAAVGGDGTPWLVALGELDRVRLFEIGTTGEAVPRGTLPCGAAREDPVAPAVARVAGGWLVGCAGDGAYLHRLDEGFEPTWSPFRTLAEPTGEGVATLAASVDGDRVLWAWGPPLTLAVIDAETGEVLDRRQVGSFGPALGVAARAGRLAVMTAFDPFQFRLLLLEGLQDAELGMFTEWGPDPPEVTSPVFVGDELWVCHAPGWWLRNVMRQVVCTQVDPQSGEGVERVVIAGGWDGGLMGAAGGSASGLVVGYTVPDLENGTLRGAVQVLEAEVPVGDGGLPDGGDSGNGGGARDAGGGPDGDAGGADAGGPDAGAPDAGGPDAGHGDAGAPDAGNGDDAGVPEGLPTEQGGCNGCSAPGGDAFAGALVILTLVSLRRRSAAH